IIPGKVRPLSCRPTEGHPQVLIIALWEFNRAVYRHAPDRGHAELTDKILLDRAREAEVPDLARFQTAVESDRLLPAVQQDIQEAVAIGAASTPVFLINDQPVVGAQPLDVFISVIEQAQR
ncbi:DsbA family protein, partial [Mycobacteroides abscessus]